MYSELLISFCGFQEYPEYSAYETPLFFSDDWLNIYLDKYRMHTDPDSYQEKNEISCSDYRFVYMGAKGWHRHNDLFLVSRDFLFSEFKEYIFICQIVFLHEYSNKK